MMGCGGRGKWLLNNELIKRPEIEIAYLSDIDQARLHEAADLVQDRTGKRPKLVDDFRRILDDPNVNAFFNITPDHWHALATIWACQAGKDVFVEKPASHSVWEGRKMVEAARKYDRIVQVGTQTRSGDYTAEAVRFLRGGALGDIHLVRVLNMKNREPVPPQPDGPVPGGVDYEKWLGPAPMRAFNPNHFHYKWHWFWNYSGGDIINDGVHQLDAARMLIGKGYPNAVVSTGGKLAYDDAQETPDTQVATWEYDDMMMVFELTLWTPHMQKTAWDFRDTDGFPDWRINATQVEVHGTKGMMKYSRHGGGWQAWAPDGTLIKQVPGRHPHGPHVDNFFECMRSRKRPNADIEEGHRSTLLALIANISYRLRGRRLEFDGESESFVGDRRANEYLKRTYRKPWIVPEAV
jgi:predicted dehydrogenase